MFRGPEPPKPGTIYTVHQKTYTMPDITYDADVPNLLHQSALEEAYDAMKLIHELFTEAGITYVAYGGTLLGAMRHGGQIPWDDDIDICVLGTKENIRKIGALKERFQKGGFQLLKCCPGFAVQKEWFPALSADIFFMDERIPGTGIYESSYPYDKNGKATFMVQEGWREMRMPIDWENGIQTHPFFDFEINIPKNYKEHLCIMYRSKACLTHAKYSADSQLFHVFRYIRPITEYYDDSRSMKEHRLMTTFILSFYPED